MLFDLGVLALAASLVAATPTMAAVVDEMPIDDGDNGTTIYYYTNTSSLTRANPTYNQSTLNAIKLAYTSNERLSIIRSLGNTDDYFKYDFSPTLSAGNAGSGQGGQGVLAQALNFPVLLNTGLSMAIGFLGPCTWFTTMFEHELILCRRPGQYAHT